MRMKMDEHDVSPEAHPTKQAPPTLTLARDDLAEAARSLGDSQGWLTCSADGSLQISLSPAELEAARRITARCLLAAGILDSDRAVVALNSDGAGVGVLWAEAASTVCRAATATRADGTRRLLGRLSAANATVLICTPTAARQLAQLVDDEPDRHPRLRRVIVVGEIIAGCDAQTISSSLGCLVSEAWPDPVFGVALAWRDALSSAAFRRVDPALLTTEAVTDDVAEWIVHPSWCDELHGISYRSGVVCVSSDCDVLDRPRWTTGDHLLIRGRWLSCSALERELNGLGVERWQLRVRRLGTGEHIELAVASETVDPIHAALPTVTPLRVEVTMEQFSDTVPRLRDERGHHLGQPFSMPALAADR